MARGINRRPKGKLTLENLRKSIQIFKYILPYKHYFILGMVLLVGGSLMFMLIPGVAGELVNTASGEGKYGLTLNQWGIVLFILILGQAVLSYFRTIVFAIVSEKGMANVRSDLYNKMITQSIGFYETHRVGELTSRITTDVAHLRNVFATTLAQFLRQSVILISGIVILSYLTPNLAFIMLMTFPLIVILAVFFGRYIRRIARKRQDQLADSNTIVEETFQSFSVVKSFTNEWYESLRYMGSINKLVKISLDLAKVRGLFYAFIIALLFGCIMFILWRGAFMVQNGTMEAGNLFSFVIYTMVIGGAIASFGTLYATILGAIGATERVQAILNSETEVNIENSAEPKALLLAGNIRYEDVSFSYPTRVDIEVLKGINLEIEQGSKVALVGQSGSGKTTIVQLLLKFYGIGEGKITIDGRNINEFELSAYRQNIGIVPQEVMLFGGTIKENILYGKPNATDEELYEAAKKSNCLEFIESFPEKFETVVGERGIKLSGGQRQRIAIARAILKDPSILILDEATSSLDAESERIVQEALNVLMEGRTSIIIAHRLATIKNVDRIYVIENGVIVEEGSHSELFEKEDGTYSQLAKLQFELH